MVITCIYCGKQISLDRVEDYYKHGWYQTPSWICPDCGKVLQQYKNKEVLDCPIHGALCAGCNSGRWVKLEDASERTRQGFIRNLRYMTVARK